MRNVTNDVYCKLWMHVKGWFFMHPGPKDKIRRHLVSVNNANNVEIHMPVKEAIGATNYIGIR